MEKYELVILDAIATVLADSAGSSKVRALRITALRNVLGILKHYEAHIYDSEKLLLPIAVKKSQWILEATTKKEMDEIVKPPRPVYSGNGFTVGRFATDEEECILWSETSLKGPLISVGQKRFMELFRKLYPEMHI